MKKIAAVFLWTAFALPAWATPPKLITQAEIQAIANDPAQWNPLKTKCDNGLNNFVDDTYQGVDWHTHTEEYVTCYSVAKYLNLSPTVVTNYAKKSVAMMKVLARDHFYGTPNQHQKFLALGDGSTRVFALPLTPMTGVPAGQVKVYITDLVEKAFTYTGTTIGIDGFYPILRVSNTSGGPANYVMNVDYRPAFYNSIQWLSANHPATGAPFYAMVANQAFNLQPAGNVSVSGNTLTLSAAPTANQAVFVLYLGQDYEQTGNGMGGVGAVRVDSGFGLRSVGVGLAHAYDLMREEPLFTPALRTEFTNTLNDEMDWYLGYIGPGGDSHPLSNYAIEGTVTATVYISFATDDDNTRAQSGGDLRNLAQSLMTKLAANLDKYIPGGFGPEGSYENGTQALTLKLFDIWKRQTGVDLVSGLNWNKNLALAIIHGTKPDRNTINSRTGRPGTYYDGGNWDPPAYPLTNVVNSLVNYEPNHPDAPYARQYLADLGVPVAGPAADYKAFFKPSYLAKGSGVLYARSDWSTSAVWLSLAVGPIFEFGHQTANRGHFTLQRGADYLLITGGLGLDIYDTIPAYNSFAFDDRGAGNLIIYPDPPSQNAQEEDYTKSPPTKWTEGTAFVYGQEDMTRSYKKDETTNAVKRAVRTVVYIRPDVTVVHDQAQVNDAGTRTYFNMNFGGTLVLPPAGGDTFSAATGSSKVFMRSLVPASPSPAVTRKGATMTFRHGATFTLLGDNYQIMTTGQSANTFLHIFQAAPSGQSAMAASSYVQSADTRVQGAVVDMTASGGGKWVVLNASTATVLSLTATAPLVYTVPMACPCSHVVGDLPPSTTYPITVNGAPASTPSATTDANGVLFFTTNNTGTGDQIKIGSGVADTLSPARPRGLRKR